MSEQADKSLIPTSLSALALNRLLQSEQNPSEVRIYVAEHEAISLIHVIFTSSPLEFDGHAVQYPSEERICVAEHESRSLMQVLFAALALKLDSQLVQ
jgi:hypothetical protein